jgi:5-methyltetrahydrofolate--homocysteine methyltransferase
MTFTELLKSDKLIYADGAQGTELRRLLSEAGEPPVESPHLLNFSAPGLVRQVVRAYADAGSDFVCANTFSINRFNVRDVDAEIKQALTIAKEALAGTGALTALDVTTLGKLLEPSGSLTFEEAYDAYKEIMTAGERHGADLVIIETMTDLYEAKAALLALKENTRLPVICSMTFESGGRTFTGTPVSCMAATLEGLGADALGINCSLGPAELKALVPELLNCTALPVMVKPNAGLPDPETGEFRLTAADFAEQMAEYPLMGARILGGCCGTTPEFIRRLRADARALRAAPARRGAAAPVVCGYSDTVTIDRPRIIGERINPTGKKAMKQALLDNDTGYILRQAAEQISAGADILDVNVGAAGVDEVETLPRVVKAVQSITGMALQLDSANPKALEAALRVYNGKPVVNSVNAEDESLDAVLPLVKKYGAAVVGLTLDKAGIPKSAGERLVLAEKILNRALALGIKRENVFIDCLTLTVGSEQDSAAETLEAVRLVKEKLGLRTVLGVSNISFGLPGRGVINRTFLALALQSGLDLPIMNPNDRDMADMFRAFNVLSGTDKNAADYISHAGEPAAPPPHSSDITLEYAVMSGLKTEAAAVTKALLANTEPLEIINKSLIPALDTVGELFGQGKLFLPQLMLSAECAAACFEILKTAFGEASANADKEILLATVKGDIHDIGKNIVKTMLESYGYRVADLGRDVAPEAIAAEAERRGVRLVGLSSLMTTTLPAMKETVRLLKEKTDCRIMVGGAVLTEDYAKSIGADFYGRDAKSAVDIAADVFARRDKNT